MSVFDVLKHNLDNEVDVVTMAYKTYATRLREAQAEEREAICAKLESYFELIRYSVEIEGAEQNLEWEAGFQAALAFVKGENK